MNQTGQIQNNSKKRILFFVNSMQDGGAERVAALLCNAWVAEGNEVILMPIFSGRGECSYPLDHRIQIVFLADCVNTIKKTFWTKLRRLRMIRKCIQDFTVDVVVSFLTEVNIATIIAATGINIPVIISERTFPPLSQQPLFWSILRRFTYPQATCVIAQTEKTKTWIEKHCPGTLVKVIPNPLVWPLPSSLPAIKPQDWLAPDRKLLLAVGRLHPVKGFDILLDAFSKVVPSNPDWDLIILGEGKERKKLEAKQSDLDLKDNVIILGRVGNMTEWYERASLFVMCSHYEGFPNVLLEAMGHGVPVVSVNCDTGPSDLIQHKQNGLLISQQDALTIAKALAQMMGNSKLRLYYSKQAIKVRERFSLKRITGLWGNIFNEYLQ